MQQSPMLQNKQRKPADVLPLNIQIPRDVKARLLKQSKAEFRSLSAHCAFLLAQGSVNLEKGES
jgi:hypothetical protein